MNDLPLRRPRTNAVLDFDSVERERGLSLDEIVPLSERLAATFTEDEADQVLHYLNDDPLLAPPSHLLGWDLRRLFGDSTGRDLYEAARWMFDEIENDATDDEWATFNRRRHPSDRLLIDLADDVLAESWPPLDRLRDIAAQRRIARRKAEDSEMTIILPFPQPANRQATPVEEPQPRLQPRRISASSLDGQPVPEREWLVPGLIPARNVTLLYGDGGTGKSLIALQLAAAVAAGGPFFGRPVSRGRVEFISAEDEIGEMHRRLVDIAGRNLKTLADFADLHLASFADDNALLALPEDGRGGTLVATALYGEIDALLADSRPALLVIDTLADAFGGNEIVRAQVRQFVGMLRRLAVLHGVTVLVLAHPSLAGMEKGTSGSTGWSNSVRSRLYFDRVRESDGRELDDCARILRVMKSNYGPTGVEIAVRWQSGVFVPANTIPGSDPLSQAAKADRVFLEILTKFTAQNRGVSLSTGANYAPAVFARDASASGVSKRALADAMNRLLERGEIENAPYGPPSRGTRRLVAISPRS